MLDSTAIRMKHLASRANVCSSLMKVSSVIQLNRNALIGLFVTTMYARLRVVWKMVQSYQPQKTWSYANQTLHQRTLTTHTHVCQAPSWTQRTTVAKKVQTALTTSTAMHWTRLTIWSQSVDTQTQAFHRVLSKRVMSHTISICSTYGSSGLQSPSVIC